MGITLSKNLVHDIGQVIRINKHEKDNDENGKIKETCADQFEMGVLIRNKDNSKSENSNFRDLDEADFESEETLVTQFETSRKIEKELNCKNFYLFEQSTENSEKQTTNTLENHNILKTNDIEPFCYSVSLKEGEYRSKLPSNIHNSEETNFINASYIPKTTLANKFELDDVTHDLYKSLDNTKEQIVGEMFEQDKIRINTYALKEFIDKSIIEESIKKIRSLNNHFLLCDSEFLENEFETENASDLLDSTNLNIQQIVLELVNKLIDDTVKIHESQLLETFIENPKEELILEDDRDNIENWRSLVNSLCQNDGLNSYALSKKRNQFSSISELITYFSEYEFKNEIEKAWLIYVWVTDNIEYNFEGYVKGDYGENDSINVLKSGKSVCAGYSNLFEELSQGLGIECRSILGYSKAFSYKLGQKIVKPNHEWNIIKLDGQWFNVEPTWGAGYGDLAANKFVKRFEPFWFLTPHELFMYKHFSEEAEKFSFRKHKMGPSSLEEFEQMPLLQLEFHLNDLHFISPISIRTNSVITSNENPLIIEIAAPKQTQLMANLKDLNDKNVILIERDSQTLKYRVICFLPESNHQYELQIFSKSESDLEKDTFDCVAQYLVSCSCEIKNEINLSKYSLEFKYGLKCLSHFSRVVFEQTNIVDMEFLGCKTLSLLGKLKEKSGKVFENNVLIQEVENREDEETKIFKIKLILPNKDTLYNFEFFASNNPKNLKYEYAGEILMRRSNNDDQDLSKFVKTYFGDLDSFIYSPINFNLKSGQMYTFKYYMKNALEVALVDANDKWIYLKRLENENFLWSKEISVDALGDLCLYVKYKENSEFDGFCSYQIV